MSMDSRRRSIYCISDTSPLNPTTADSPNTRRRLTSVKRDKDPYEADL